MMRKPKTVVEYAYLQFAYDKLVKEVNGRNVRLLQNDDSFRKFFDCLEFADYQLSKEFNEYLQKKYSELAELYNRSVDDAGENSKYADEIKAQLYFTDEVSNRLPNLTCGM